MATSGSGWWRDVAAICRKEVQSELRTRYALNAILLFAVTTVTMVGLTTAGGGVPARLQAPLFWLVVFFSAQSALSQVFVKEEETGTVMALRLAARPNAVFFGKLLFNLMLLALLQALIIPLFLMLVGMYVVDWPVFIASVVLGTLGLAGATTIVAAIVARTTARGALFAVLSFPLLLPLLVAAVGSTQAALDPVGAGHVVADFKLLVSYGIAMLTASWLLFEFVWEA